MMAITSVSLNSFFFLNRKIVLTTRPMKGLLDVVYNKLMWKGMDLEAGHPK